MDKKKPTNILYRCECAIDQHAIFVTFPPPLFGNGPVRPTVGSVPTLTPPAEKMVGEAL